MGDLQAGIHPDATADVGQAVAEFDVFDRGMVVDLFVEATEPQERLPTHRTAGTPERGGVGPDPLVVMVVQQVLVARQHVAGGRLVVVAPDQCLQFGIGREGRANPVDGVGMHDDVGIHEQQHVRRHRVCAAVAGCCGTRASAQHDDMVGDPLDLGHHVRRPAVDRDHQLVLRRRRQRRQALGEGGPSGVGRQHNGDAGDHGSSGEEWKGWTGMHDIPPGPMTHGGPTPPLGRRSFDMRPTVTTRP